MDEASAKRVWVSPVNDLEAETIVDLLREHGETILVTGQPWGATWEGLEPEIQSRLSGVVVIGVELAGPNRWNARNVDHHRYAGEDRSNPHSSLEQVSAILGVSLDHHQKLVAANDRGYIPELERAGATSEEISAIRAADRRAQGLTEADEARAEAEVAGAKDLGNGKWLVPCERPTSAHLDRLYSRASEVLLTGKDEWLYTGPRSGELGHMRFKEQHWSGGSPSSGYFGIKSPGRRAHDDLLAWFILASQSDSSGL